MANETKHLIFIKPGGQLVAMMPEDSDISLIDNTKFDVKTVELDLETGEYWHGDYATGEVKSKSDKPVVMEATLKYNTNLKILEQYSIHKQLNIIIDMLDASSIPNTDEFTAMKAFIDAAKADLDTKVATYKASPETYTFVSVDDDIAHADAVKAFE